MFQIVNCEDGCRLSNRRIAQDGIEHQWNKSGRPIVAVHDVGDPAELLAKRERAAAEKREA